MTSVTSAAMYTDIAAMAIHDPLKPGRWAQQSLMDAQCTVKGLGNNWVLACLLGKQLSHFGCVEQLLACLTQHGWI